MFEPFLDDEELPPIVANIALLRAQTENRSEPLDKAA
jgi:hypothetical protein